MLQKEEAKKVIAAARQSMETVTETNSPRQEVIVVADEKQEIKLRDPNVAEATDALVAVSSVEW